MSSPRATAPPARSPDATRQRRVTLLLRALAFACALVAVGVALWGFGVGPFPGIEGHYPDWIDPSAPVPSEVERTLPLWLETTLSALLVGNAAVAVLVAVRGLTPVISALCVLVGLETLGASHVLGAFSWGTPEQFTVLPELAGIVLAGIGLWVVDPAALRDVVARRPAVTTILGGVVAGVLLGVEVVTGGVSTALSLVPLVVATGGDVLLLLAALVAVRWLSASAIQWGDGRNGDAYAHAGADAGGNRWASRWRLPPVEGVNPVRLASVGVAVIGLVAVLQAPVGHVPTNPLGILCTGGPHWAEFAYAVDWSSLTVTYANGCYTDGLTLDRQFVAAGSALFVTGTAGDLVAGGGDAESGYDARPS